MIEQKTFEQITGVTLDYAGKLVNNINEQYYSFPIIKSTGKKRWIDAPNDELKKIQLNILHEFLYQFQPHKCSFGFEKGKSVKDGAIQHQGAEVLLTMDITNFFNSFSTKNVFDGLDYFAKKVFPVTDYEKKYESFDSYEQPLALLASLMCYMGHVPQGAPSSPALTNLLCYVLDARLEEFATTHNCIYTRYADDMSFSCKDKALDIGKLIKPITTATQTYRIANLKINKKKTRIQRKHKRMSVTGIVINNGLSVPRWKWRNFQAELYNLSRDNTQISLEKYQQLRGYIEWMRTLNPARAQKFMNLLGKITLEPS
jgi:RNA-directed DNA polymerase